MKAIISPSKINGTITAPASKSAMQRACAAALIKGGKTTLRNPGFSADDKAALNIIQQLGAIVNNEDGKITIESNGINPINNKIDCGESGLSIRMFTSIAALWSEEIIITGGGSLQNRPMHFFNEVFPFLDVEIKTNNGFLPFTIKGPLIPKNITVDGSLSSQYLTGLLFAYSAANASDVSIKVNNLNSKPYIDLTLKILRDFGLKLPANRDYKEFYFANGSSKNINSKEYHVEGDWSGAAFLLVAGAIGNEVVVKGLDVFSTQADKAILQALMQAEAIVSISENEIEVKKSNLKAFHFDATDCPDLFPPVVALASYCNGTTVIEGVNRLTFKESNRALTLQEEFIKLGVEIRLQDDLMIVEGSSKINRAHVTSHNDHRIAMACAVAALGATGKVEIDYAEAVNKSYPKFWEHMQQLGTNISLINN